MLAFGLDFLVVAYGSVSGVIAGEEAAARGSADWTAGIRLSEEDAVCGKGIEVWCTDDLLAVAAEFADAQIVSEKDDDVRLALRWSGAANEREESEEKRDQKYEAHG